MVASIASFISETRAAGAVPRVLEKRGGQECFGVLVGLGEHGLKLLQLGLELVGLMLGARLGAGGFFEGERQLGVLVEPVQPVLQELLLRLLSDVIGLKSRRERPTGQAASALVAAGADRQPGAVVGSR